MICSNIGQVINSILSLCKGGKRVSTNKRMKKIGYKNMKELTATTIGDIATNIFLVSTNYIKIM